MNKLIKSEKRLSEVNVIAWGDCLAAGNHRMYLIIQEHTCSKIRKTSVKNVYNVQCIKYK